ncbi:gated mechanosensitive channel [Thozetella sp. PMI_491]|nr:gated mechanosensitive channel [Thozetella sp. PMI_491]
MPQIDNYGNAVEDEEESLLATGERRVRRLWSGFLDFALQGNILDVALGLMIASMFTAVVTSLVSDILLPPLSVLFPLNKNLDEKFAVLRPGPEYDSSNGYNTLKQAQEDGAVVMAYGYFLNKVINFIAVGVSLYSIAATYQYFSHDPILKHMIRCKYCRKYISEKALRCVNCTSWQDGREERMHGL